MIVACGGWSKRKTLYGGDGWRDRQDDLLDPETDAAKIRAFFIHPDWARQGIGTLLLDACESAARAAGFTRFEMGATLTGAKLFQQRGYVAVERLEVPLEGDITLPIIHMVKETASFSDSSNDVHLSAKMNGHSESELALKVNAMASFYSPWSR